MENDKKDKDSKGFRLLRLYERLNQGELLTKASLATDFGIGEKSVQRDIEDLRAFLADTHHDEKDISIVYDRLKKGYKLIRKDREWLTNQEIMALTKILLESRAFCKEETEQLIQKLLLQAAPEDRAGIKETILNERFYYVPLTNAMPLLETIWDMGGFIRKNQMISLDYIKLDKEEVHREVKPVALIFSEYYFYLIAYFADYEHPAVFRLDRIKNAKPTGEQFRIPYTDKFNDGEFRKRVQFMHPGKLMKIRLKIKESALEASLDRLPTAQILTRKGGHATVEAEVFGKGIKMWLFSQMDAVEVLSPGSLRGEMGEMAVKILSNYESE